MFTEALYYTYILIPDNLWLRRAILYWDKIDPIVPVEVENRISHELENYGMLEFIRPEDFANHWMEWNQACRDFIELVENLIHFGIIYPEGRRDYQYRIHRQKFNYELIKRLSRFHIYQESGQ